MVAVHRVGNSHRLCGGVSQCEEGGLDDGGDLLLAGTGVVWQQLRREWEDAAPSCLPLDVLDVVGLETYRRSVMLVPEILTCALRGEKMEGRTGEERKRSSSRM